MSYIVIQIVICVVDKINQSERRYWIRRWVAILNRLVREDFT